MKYSIVTFGCRVNQADSLRLEEDLRARGGVETASRDADLVIVNTCSVTATADQGARQTIRRIARENPTAKIVATGCYATRCADEVAALPGVVRVVRNDDKLDLSCAWASPDADLKVGPAGPRPTGRRRAVRHADRTRRRRADGVHDPRADRLRRAVRLLHHPHDARRVAEPAGRGSRARDRARRGGRVQGSHADRRAPGLVRPRPGAAVLAARAAARARRDRRATSRSASARSSRWTARRRSSRWSRGSGRFLPHFHLPLQHASDRMLAAMRRPYTLDEYRRLVDGIASRLPHASIGSDMIVGFPGRDRRRLRREPRVPAVSPLTHLHVFPYSDRPGTEASAMRDKVHGAGHPRARRAAARRSARLSPRASARHRSAPSVRA